MTGHTALPGPASGHLRREARKWLRIFALVACASLSGGACEGNAPLRDAEQPPRAKSAPVRVVARGERLMAARNGAQRVIAVDSLTSGYGMRTFTVLDQQSRTDTAYALVSAYAYSRGEGSSGQCSGGDEETILWVAVDPQLRLARAQSVLRHSCLESREFDSPNAGGFNGDSLVFTVSIHDLSTGLSRVVHVGYDRRAPALGLRIDTLPPSR